MLNKSISPLKTILDLPYTYWYRCFNIFKCFTQSRSWSRTFEKTWLLEKYWKMLKKWHFMGIVLWVRQDTSESTNQMSTRCHCSERRTQLTSKKDTDPANGNGKRIMVVLATYFLRELLLWTHLHLPMVVALSPL